VGGFYFVETENKNIIKLKFKTILKETNLMYTTAVKSVAWTPEKAEPVKLLKRIGSTTYEVTVHFSERSNETFEDKILRLIEREVRKNA